MDTVKKLTVARGLMRAIANILRTWDTASSEQVQEGMAWYEDARLHALTMGHGNVPLGAAVIAVLSPQKTWDQNLVLAQDALQGNVHGHYTGYLNKVRRLLTGENPEDVLGGPKVRAFYECIVAGGKTDTVCVDRHAFAVWHGRPGTPREMNRLGKRLAYYNRVATDYRKAAEPLGLWPAQLQAVTWVTWRETRALKGGTQ